MKSCWPFSANEEIIMIGFRNNLIELGRRYSTVQAVAKAARYSTTYHATNEPIYGYEKGSSERLELDEKLAMYASKVHDVPIVIGNEEMHSSATMHQVMPFDHKKALAKFSYADEKLIQRAIDVSQSVRREWEARPLQERGEVILRAADLITGKYRMDLMAATMLGQGKTIIQAEIDATCELADFYRFDVQFALESAKFKPIDTDISENNLLQRGLEGFWAAIAPFNFTAISGHLAGAPALMGNVVLWKPSDTAVLSSYIVFKILLEAGLPPGVINFVPADGPVFGRTITKSPLLAGINFTGSTKTFHKLWQDVAQNIETYRGYPRLIGECGGKNFHFVHPSGDMDSVVNGTIRAAFEYSGQKCSACSRIYVPRSKWAEVKAGLLAVHSKLKLGSPLEPDTFLSAVIDAKSFARNKEYIDYAKTSPNLTILAGGKCDDSKGYYIEPTIIETTDPMDKVMREEIFGPIVAAYVYEDANYKDVFKLIDESSAYALTGAIYSHDTQVVAEAREALRFSTGNFYINDKCTGSVICQQPFGGARKSGTNDKAGGPHYLQRFSSPLAVKETSEPLREWDYPYMKQ